MVFRLIPFLVLLLLWENSRAQIPPDRVLFQGLTGYWAGTAELRMPTGDTLLLPAAMDIRESFDGSMLIMHRSIRHDDHIAESIELMTFDSDSLLLRSAEAEGGVQRIHRYHVQGLPNVRSSRQWVIRRSEQDSLGFTRITDVQQNDSLIILTEKSGTGVDWRAVSILRLAARHRPPRAKFTLPGFSDAQHVSVVGDFNGWQPGRTPLTRRDGLWTTDITLPPGEYQYKYRVDGTLVRDMYSTTIIADGAGGYNTVLVIR